MDWFDDYLNALSEGKNVVYPPDSHTWRPVRPTKQQQSLIQDSVVADMVRMRLIQEARRAEEEQGMGGGYDAGSAVVEGPVAPSITVPGAPTITSIGTGNTELSAFFTAPTSNGGTAITNYKYSTNKGISFSARSPASTSSPIRITGLTNGTEYDVRIRAVNSTGDGTISNALSGTPVAPAPSGIPVASTNSINIAGYGTFSKKTADQAITSDGLLIYGFPVGGVAYSTMGYPPNTIALIGPYPPTYLGDMNPNSFAGWTLYRIPSYEGGDTSAWVNGGEVLASNSSTDITTIPTAGWSPSITITAV